MLSDPTPLAARMRPRNRDEIVGQSAALKPGSPLDRILTGSSGAQSVLLWGPPGTGKTSIAHVIAATSGRRLEQLSAVTAGVKEVRAVIDKAREESELYGKSTYLFLDEIHRFSKSQQDSLLPAVEAGWITLIAATTENPSFSVIAPLLSRSISIALEPISDEDIALLISRAVDDARGLGGEVSVDEEALALLVRLAAGDARRALSSLEGAAFACISRLAGKKGKLSADDVATAITSAPARYDRDGDMHYDVISAFIKSVRGSDADAAIHYLARMIDAGEDPRFIARRLVILAAEDVGLADPAALGIATAAADAVAFIGMPEGRIPLAVATIYLATAPKSNSAYNAINEALEDVRAGLTPAIPKHLRSATGVGYKYPHDDARGILEQDYAPDKVAAKSYYRPKQSGAERERGALWQVLKSIIRGKN
jgi:putative ATPase